ncbi:membrane protein insertase YidC [candidate division GN15 bacterium]|nr:membrane protein insertase YidC [candidate division GN15 bacterium]
MTVDRKSIVLVVLLAVVILFYWQILEFLGLHEPAPEQPAQTTEQVDTATAEQPPPQQQPTDTQPTRAAEPTGDLPSLLTDTTGAVAKQTDTLPFMAEQAGVIDTIVVETDTYEVILINQGGGPVSMLLKEHSYRDGEPIEMLPEPMNVSPEASFAQGAVMTGQLPFESSLASGTYNVSGQPLEVEYRYVAPNGVEFFKRYWFHRDKYSFDMVLEVRNGDRLGIDRKYYMVWNNPPPVTEPDPKTDYNEMNAVAYMGGSREQLDDYEDSQLDQTLLGTTSWAGVRSKYFTATMIPRSQLAEGVRAEGRKWKVQTPDGSMEKRDVTVALEMPFAGSGAVTDSFTVFVGPMDYFLMSDYEVGLEDMLGIGTTPVVGWIIKPFAWIVMWGLPKLFSVVGNYGWVIIIFALLIKLVTMPLSLKSFKSMQAMKDLQPKIEELKKKHSKNPQAMNQEMMKLYKKHGVNPLSGCLPILLQMPLLFAMFTVFRSTILLRDAPFIWFIQDLSHGATGFTDPYIVLVIIMVGAQFLSQHLTMASSTQQNKALMYMMPPVMGFFLYSLPAGLILYWICFSVFSLLDWLVYKRDKKNMQVQPA